jgi:hypothetical protein
MVRLPLIVTFRLDEATRARIRERVGANRSLKSFSQFVREGIALRLERDDPFVGWSVGLDGRAYTSVLEKRRSER